MKIEKNVLLSDYNTYKIGGKADYFVCAQDKQTLIAAIDYARLHDIPFLLLGGGSNILFPDAGIRGMVICNRAQEYRFSPGFATFSSGIPLKKMLDLCVEHSVSGMDFLAGIPGTLGGAIYGNAGAYGKSISDLLQKIVLYGEHGVEVVESGVLNFSYRYSDLKKNGYVVLEAQISLQYGTREQEEEKIAHIMMQRKGKHPELHIGSCGCFFKNVDMGGERKISAGKLLQDAGVCGLSVGDAYVFEGHCNFILNKNSAAASDVVQLAELMKHKVFEKTGIELSAEVRILSPEFPFFTSDT